MLSQTTFFTPLDAVSKNSQNNDTIIITPKGLGLDKNAVYYEEGVLPYIAGTADTILALTNADDLIITPGRSLFQITKYLNLLASREQRAKRNIFAPAFSKGGLLSPEKIKKYAEYIEQNGHLYNNNIKEVQEPLTTLKNSLAQASDLETKTNIIRSIVKLFENSLCFYDFENDAIKSLADFTFSPQLIHIYRKYLEQVVNISPSKLAQVKGKIFVIDTIQSGEGLYAFIKVLLDWCKEQGLDISNNLCIWNFGKEEKQTLSGEGTDDIKISGNLIIPENQWAELSFNYIQDESTFFPPWAWNQICLWENKITEELKTQYHEMNVFLTATFQQSFATSERTDEVVTHFSSTPTNK